MDAATNAHLFVLGKCCADLMPHFMGQTGAIGWFFGVWVPQPLAGVNHKLLIMPHKASRR